MKLVILRLKKLRSCRLIGLVVTLGMLFAACSDDPHQGVFIPVLSNHDVLSLVLYKDTVIAGCAQGLYKIDKTTNEVLEINGDLTLVKSLVVSENKLYIGHDQGIHLFDGENFKQLLSSQDLSGDVRVNSMIVTKNNELLVATFEGVLIKSEKGWSRLTTQDGLLDNTVNLVLEDDHGGWLFGHYASRRGGVSYLHKKKWSYLTQADGLPHNYIASGFVSDNLFYLATGFYEEGGVAVLKATGNHLKIEEVIIKEWGQHGYKARSLYKEGDKLWVGTEYNGLCILDKESMVQFNEDQGLMSNEIKVILVDEQTAWLATKNGLAKVNKNELNDF